MANFSAISFLSLTFLALIMTSSARVQLTKESDEVYILTKKIKHVVVECSARHADDISFTCAGGQVPDSSVEMDDPVDQVMTKRIRVTRTDLKHAKSLGEAEFWCQCTATSGDGEMDRGKRSYIVFAQLGKRFLRSPQKTEAVIGHKAVFECRSPKAKPKAEIMWRKNKRRLNVEADDRMTITRMGDLEIEDVRGDDAGFYTCVAKNPAGRKESSPAELTVSSYEEVTQPYAEYPESSTEGKSRTVRQSTADGDVYFTTVPDETYYITERETTTLRCAAVGASLLTFRCNGQRMNDRERYKSDSGVDPQGKSIVQATLKLAYSDVRQYKSEFGDNSNYQCLCMAWFQDDGKWNKISTEDNRGIVYLSYLDRKFQVEPPQTLTVGVGSNAVLECEPPKGVPRPYVKWFKDNQRIETAAVRTNPHYDVNTRGHLTISRVTYDDMGVYTCRAENTVAEYSSRRSRLVVTDDIRSIDTTTPATTTTTQSPVDAAMSFPASIPDTAQFLVDLQPRYVTSEGDVSLVCSIVSAEMLTINCNNARIPKDKIQGEEKKDRVSGKKIIYARYDLPASEISSDDYFCQCTGWYLKPNNGGWGNVQGERAQFVMEDGGDSQGPFIQDEFLEEPRGTTANAGTEIALRCQPPVGLPVPSVYWLKDGQRVVPNKTFFIDGNDLIIDPVRRSHEGRYTCVAENPAGRKSSRPATLRVRPKERTTKPPTPRPTPRPTPPPTPRMTTTFDYGDYGDYDMTNPFYMKEPQNQFIQYQDSVSLHCQVTMAKLLIFECNGKPIEASRDTATKTQMPAMGMGRDTVILDNSLEVTKAEVASWAGTEPYTCRCRAYYEVEGDLPGQWTHFEPSKPATIEIAYLHTKFNLEPVDQSVERGSQAELRCQPPPGVPTPEVTWVKDGYVLQQDNNVKITGTGSLMFQQFTEANVGSYQCRATNSIGTRTSNSVSVTLAGSGPVAGDCRMGIADCVVKMPKTQPTNPEELQQFCGVVNKAIKCMDDVKARCPDVDISMADQMRSVCGSSGGPGDCSMGVNTCLMKMPMSQPSASEMQQYCVVVNEAIECMDEVKARCPDVDISMADQMRSVCGGSGQCNMGLQSCLMKLPQTQASRDEMPQYCVAVNEAIQCMDDVKAKCPDVDISMAEQMRSVCGGSGQCNMGITPCLMKLPQTQPSSDDMPQYCVAVNEAIQCMDDVKAKCPHVDISMAEQMRPVCAMFGGDSSGGTTGGAGGDCAIQRAMGCVNEVDGMAGPPSDEALHSNQAGICDKVFAAQGCMQEYMQDCAMVLGHNKASIEQITRAVAGSAAKCPGGGSREPMPPTTEDTGVQRLDSKQPFFSKDLQSHYYFVNGVTSQPLVCEAYNVDVIYIVCGRSANRLDDVTITERMDQYEAEDGSKGMRQVVHAEVTSLHVADVGYTDDDTCQCIGQVEGGMVRSARAYFTNAYLRANFIKSPMNTTKQVGSFATLECTPPEGDPMPEVTWYKGDTVVHTSVPNTLVFESVSHDDSGYYKCEATNVAGTRTSESAALKVLAGGMPDGGMPDGGMPDHGMGGMPEEGAAQCNMQLQKCSELLKSIADYPDQTCVVFGRYKACIQDAPSEHCTRFIQDTMQGMMHLSTMCDGMAGGDDGDDGMTGGHDGMGGGMGGGMAGGMGGMGDECQAMVQNCMQHTQMNQDSNFEAACQNRQCIDEMVMKCGAQYPKIVEQMMQAKAQLDKHCNQILNLVPCPAIHSCLQTFANAPQTFDEMSVSVADLCRGSPSERDTILLSFITCVNEGLASCSLDINERNDTGVRDILANMCDKFYNRDSCEDLDQCKIMLTPLERNNHQYWCRSFTSIMECADISNEACRDTNNFRPDIRATRDNLREFSCPQDPTIITMLETTPEPGMFDPDVDQTTSMADDGTSMAGVDASSEPGMTEVGEDGIVPVTGSKVEGQPSRGGDGDVMATSDPSDGGEGQTTDMDGEGMDSTMMGKDGMGKEGMGKDGMGMGGKTMGTSDGDMPTTQPEDGGEKMDEKTPEPTIPKPEEKEPMDPQAGETKNPDSGAPLTMTSSILLTTCMQLILAALLSWR